MQTTPFQFLLLGLSLLAVTGANAQSNGPRFNLQANRKTAANSYPGAGNFPAAGKYDVVIDYHVEIDATSGDAVINRTSGYPGFTSYFTPTPRGSLYKEYTGEQGVLTPLPGNPNTNYQLQYLPSYSIPSNALLQNYTTSIWECHGKCSRYDLIFRDDQGSGYWYISPRGDEGVWEEVDIEGTLQSVWRGVWNVRWRRGRPYVVEEGELAGLGLVQADWDE